MTAVPAPISVNNTGALTLPLLKNDTRYNGMPRRYQDTKPVIIQNFSHRYIMDLGEKFHRSSIEKQEVEKIHAIRSAEEALWARAEELRKDSIEKALTKAKAAHEKDLKKLQRQHERQLKDELFRLEQALRLESAEQLKQEKQDGEKRLQEAVLQTEIRLEEIKVKEVAQARIEEREKSIQEIADLKQEFKDKYALGVVEWKRDKAEALEALRKQMTEERDLAVACAHHEEKAIADASEARLKALHDQAVRVLKTHISELKEEIVRQENIVESLRRQKKFVEDEVLATRNCFQKFIDDVKPFEPGKSEYVMPPLKMQRTESVLSIKLSKR